jgi:hypothetical protein
MHRRNPIAVLATLPLLAVLAACEQKTATDPAAAPAAKESAPKTATAPAAAPAAGGATHTVAFELAGDAAVGALQIDIGYAGAGRFVGDADAVACETKVEGALSSYNHIVEQKMLRAAYVAVKGFSGPTRFSECKFEGDAKPADFTVTVKDSSSPDLTPLEPPPSVKVVVD